MRSLETVTMALATAALLAGCAGNTMNSATASPHARAMALGTPIVEPDLVAWNIDVRGPDGRGLPPGSGNARTGKAVFDAKCASCHGAAAAGGPMFGTMVGGIGSFKTDKRVLTPGSMYPYAPALFDYIRRAMPRFAPEAYAANLQLLAGYRAIAAEVGCTPAQLALAWLLHKGQDIIPIPGTTSVEHLHDDLGAVQVQLGSAVIERLEALINERTVVGNRYNPQNASEVDTEAYAERTGV